MNAAFALSRESARDSSSRLLAIAAWRGALCLAPVGWAVGLRDGGYSLVSCLIGLSDAWTISTGSAFELIRELPSRSLPSHQASSSERRVRSRTPDALTPEVSGLRGGLNRDPLGSWDESASGCERRVRGCSGNSCSS